MLVFMPGHIALWGRSGKGAVVKSLAERQVLAEVPDLVARLLDGAPVAGGRVEIEPVRQRLGHPVGDVLLCQMRDVVWAPRSGLLIGADGGAVQSSVLAAGERALSMPRGSEVHVARATVFAGFGARRNYGHFLFDGVAGLGAMADLGLLDRYPAMAGPLHGWQRQILSLARLPVAEVKVRRVLIGEVVFVTAMNHYLHRCDGLLRALVDRMGGQGQAGHEVVYLSRRGRTGRVLVGESALEAALQAHGVRVLRPEAMPVADQIAAMRGARVVVGASGAALANVIFAPRGAAVLEIRPEPVREPWVDLSCDLMGLRHLVLPVPVVPPSEVPFWARLRRAPRQMLRRYNYATRVDPDAVLAALDRL